LLRRIEQVSGLKEKIVPDGLRLGIGDDAALFAGRRGYETILTCDWFLEGLHFLRDKHPPDAVGWKCLARAVSDVAAMAGTPRYFLLSLALPSTRTGYWLNEFLRGLRRASNCFGCILAGGDTTRHQKTLVSVTVVGEVKAGRAVLREGAEPGDVIFVSGRLGEAELGLRILRRLRYQAGKRNPLLRKHLYPQPRMALGRWLGKSKLASAMMDLSDGLSMDLSRLCAASGVGARLEAESIPTVRRSGSKENEGLQLALHGGDDYELLFTVPRNKVKWLSRSFRGTPLTAIGEITRERILLLQDVDGRIRPLADRGWDPFHEARKP